MFYNKMIAHTTEKEQTAAWLSCGCHKLRLFKFFGVLQETFSSFTELMGLEIYNTINHQDIW